VLYFGDEDIWLEAKPLVLYLEYSPSHVTQTLNIVKDKNKKSLKELLDAKGSPKWVDLSDRSTPGYHDLKALYVNEPGLYSLIFKSTKPQAQDFQDWVYEEVLTALRRRGSYSVGENKELLRDVLGILGKRDEEWQLALRHGL
jgi:prophage antirepressor-like protein